MSVATQRSGTKAFGSALDRGDLVTALGEILNPDFAKHEVDLLGALAAHRGDVGFGVGVESVFEALDAELHAIAARMPTPLVHVDLMYNQLGFLAPLWEPVEWGQVSSPLLQYLVSRGVPFVHLRRPARNALLSELRMCLSGVSHSDLHGRTYIAGPAPWGDIERDGNLEPMWRWAGQRLRQIRRWEAMVSAAQDLPGAYSITLHYDTLFSESGLSVSSTQAVARLLTAVFPGLVEAEGTAVLSRSTFFRRPMETHVDLRPPDWFQDLVARDD